MRKPMHAAARNRQRTLNALLVLQALLVGLHMSSVLQLGAPSPSLDIIYGGAWGSLGPPRESQRVSVTAGCGGGSADQQAGTAGRWLKVASRSHQTWPESFWRLCDILFRGRHIRKESENMGQEAGQP